MITTIKERKRKLTEHSCTAIRIRPSLKPTDPGFELIPQRFQRPVVQLTSPTSLTIDSPQGRKLFVFDRVFGEDVEQEGIWDYLTDSINHFVQGYNVSMLAYGQSGAGKSYTMGTSGPAEQGDAEIMGKLCLLCNRVCFHWYSLCCELTFHALQVLSHELQQLCLRSWKVVGLRATETRCPVSAHRHDTP